MAVKVVFYSLAPKPPGGGWIRVYEAVAAGKVYRGRRWFRLEACSSDVYLFPAGTGEREVVGWFAANPDCRLARVAFMLGGRFFLLDNGVALSAVTGGHAARANAISQYEAGRKDWAVFIP